MQMRYDGDLDRDRDLMRARFLLKEKRGRALGDRPEVPSLRLPVLVKKPKTVPTRSKHDHSKAQREAHGRYMYIIY